MHSNCNAMFLSKQECNLITVIRQSHTCFDARYSAYRNIPVDSGVYFVLLPVDISVYFVLFYPVPLTLVVSIVPDLRLGSNCTSQSGLSCKVINQ